jgi:hypothetical protein
MRRAGVMLRGGMGVLLILSRARSSVTGADGYSSSSIKVLCTYVRNAPVSQRSDERGSDWRSR